MTTAQQPHIMNPVYLDHSATTPVRDEVRAAMAPFQAQVFGNPSSLHRWGREAAAALYEARATCAGALGVRADEVFFVRGGTESDNLALQGRVSRLRADGHTPTVVVSAIEHKAVLEAAEATTARGAGRLVVLKVDPDGSLDLDSLDRALADGPCVVSTMWVNNETGIRLPVEEVAARTRAAGATLHSDAVQAVGKVPVRLDDVPVDVLTVTGHKIYGPKGTGLLIVRADTALSPLVHGGGQERALRPGTEDVGGAVGVATALRLAVEEQEDEARRLETLRGRLEGELSDRIEGLRVNGGGAPRAPHVASVGIPNVDGPLLLMSLDLEGIAASGGSACNSSAARGSHVIAALYGDEDPYGTIRFSLGHATTDEDVTRVVEVMTGIVTRLRDRGAPQ